jgi:hypothetical protein
VGPYVKSNSRAVKAKLTRVHCSTSATRCRHLAQDSWKVFHSDGDGNERTHACSQTSNNTLRTRSHSWSPTSPVIVGGASSKSLMASKKSSNASQVSRLRICDIWTACCRVRRTRWQRTACRLMVSAPRRNENRLVLGSYACQLIERE